jgi:hypothetical protein
MPRGGRREGSGRPAHVPTPEMRRQIETMIGFGIPKMAISKILNIGETTIKKHYSEEISTGTAKANAQVAGFLFNAAKAGNVTACIFWLKARAGWEAVAD